MKPTLLMPTEMGKFIEIAKEKDEDTQRIFMSILAILSLDETLVLGELFNCRFTEFNENLINTLRTMDFEKFKPEFIDYLERKLKEIEPIIEKTKSKVKGEE